MKYLPPASLCNKRLVHRRYAGYKYNALLVVAVAYTARFACIANIAACNNYYSHYLFTAQYLGNMKQTRKIRLVFEVDVQQDTELTPEVVGRILSTYSNYKEFINDEYWQENIKQNNILLTALLARPEQYRHFLLEALENATETGQFLSLAGISEPDEDPLESILPELPAESTAYFVQMQQEGIFSERTELITFSLNTTITGIHLETIAGETLTH